MTELLPYYRLAERYGLRSLFVMNKVEEQAVVADYSAQLDASRIFIIARDDAAYEPPADSGLPALRQAVGFIKIQPQADDVRIADLMDRLRDQLIEPARHDRREIDRLAQSLAALETPAVGVDVNPLTQQLQRRLQQRSVLYLMGPARVLDRVRQVPKMLARLPRTTWDLLRAGKLSRNGKDDLPIDAANDQPNFRAVLIDQFTIVQSRIDDLLRSDSAIADRLQNSDYAASKLDPATAGDIADDEIAKLRDWLTKQWNATPRDTAMLQKLLKTLPGGAKLTQWSEAAPYLLAIVVAAHHAFFGHIDLLILGGWSLATWLTEKLSNEVSARTRAANNAIANRFTRLAHQQIKSTLAWLQQQAPTTREIERLQSLADEISESLQTAAAKT
jgi:hypothetical protein